MYIYIATHIVNNNSLLNYFTKQLATYLQNIIAYLYITSTFSVYNNLYETKISVIYRAIILS